MRGEENGPIHNFASINSVFTFGGISQMKPWLLRKGGLRSIEYVREGRVFWVEDGMCVHHQTNLKTSLSGGTSILTKLRGLERELGLKLALLWLRKAFLFIKFFFFWTWAFGQWVGLRKVVYPLYINYEHLTIMWTKYTPVLLFLYWWTKENTCSQPLRKCIVSHLDWQVFDTSL